MSYREKVAWLSLIAMAAAFVPYFSIVALDYSDAQVAADAHRYMLRQLVLFGGATAVQMLILGMGHFCLRRMAPHDAALPRDERDLSIERRWTTTAYYILIAGLIVVGFLMPFSAKAWSLVHAAAFSIVFAEAVRYAGIALSYRGQA